MSDLVTKQEDDKKEATKKRTTMCLYIREVMFLFSLAITSYATWYNSLPTVGKPPAATPFFHSSSVVQDYYRGTMGGAFEQAVQADIAVVMFYAPWDAESQAARPIFDAVARFLKDDAYFAAVNCWAPASQCKTHYSKIRSFPVIVVYQQVGSGIVYKGPFESGSLIRFVRAMIRPIQRVHNRNDIVDLLTTHDAVVMGSFEFEGNLGGRGYYTFYSTAMKAFQTDFYHQIAFAVTTNLADAAGLNITELPSIRLFLSDKFYEYPLDADYNEDSVSAWIFKKLHRPAMWLNPPGTKSALLAPHVVLGPVLFLFTPGHPLLPVTPAYSLLRELSLSYSNCDNNSWLSEVTQKLKEFNRGLQSKIQRYELTCSRLKQTKKAAMMTVVPVAMINRTEPDVCEKLMGPQLEICVRPSNDSEPIQYDTSMWRPENDDFGYLALQKQAAYEECRVLEAAYQHHKIFYPDLKDSSGDLKGLSCVNNKTLSIIGLDSLNHYQFAEGLGIAVLDLPHKTAAVIVDNTAESHFVLQESISYDSLVRFIQDFSQGKLERFLKSTEDNEAFALSRFSYPIKNEENCRHSHTESCVPELHSRNFVSTVMDSTKAVIVFYHSPLCATCRSVSHIFLLISRYFRHFPTLRFVRIDGERNDLPWKYTVDIYPTILFFPVSNKDDSRVFNENLPFTVKTVMHFILANLESEAKIPAMLSLCSNFEKQQTKEEMKNCKAKIQVHVYEGLKQSLKRMRSVMTRLSSLKPETPAANQMYRRKSELMLSLQFFRAVGFELGAVEKSSHSIGTVNELYLKLITR